MPNDPLYPSSYPGPGRFVLLCEGDMVGYEAAILGRWLRERTPSGETVDVRPCGTGEALLGVADAIGRTVRLVIIEDRDFRTPEQAAADCEQKRIEREERHLALRGWLVWSRNEIENFFLDEEVLFPAMRVVFECSDQDVNAALSKAVDCLRVFQSLQAAIADADAAWRELLKGRCFGGGKPKWTSMGIVAPPIDEIRKRIQDHIKGLSKQGSVAREPFLGSGLQDAFDMRSNAWSAELPESTWKCDWAGKEVLKLVRQLLASQFSPPVQSRQGRIAPVDWFQIGEEIQEPDRKAKAKLQEQARDALDRDIERAIQPVLIASLFRHVHSCPSTDLQRSLDEIAACFVL